MTIKDDFIICKKKECKKCKGKGYIMVELSTREFKNYFKGNKLKLNTWNASSDEILIKIGDEL